MADPIATVKGDHAFIKVLINDKLHFSILRQELLSVQAWHVDNTLWQIEYVTKTGVRLRCDYIQRELWLNILDGLDKIAIGLE